MTQISAATPAKCAALYKALVERGGSIDTHKNTLGQLRTFFRWCIKQKLISANPAEELEAQGRRRKGKTQLRITEARKWLAVALEWGKTEEGPIAAATALLLARRSSEVIGRKVRDLDDEGRLLWIEDAKTESGNLPVEVPEVLQPYLLKLTEGKASDAPIFSCRTTQWVLDWTKRVCKQAGVTEVTAHSLRGLHATIAESVGITAHVVSQQLGHGVKAPAVTHAHYTRPEAVEAARQEKLLRVLDGGRK
jgi:integrase